MEDTFRLDESDEPQDAKLLIRQLVAYNDAVGPKEEWKSLLFTLNDENGVLKAGLKGHTHWQWLFISQSSRSSMQSIIDQSAI